MPPSSFQSISPAAPNDSSGSSTGMAGLGRRGVEWWADNARHAKRTPGAYEWWHFEAIDHHGNGVVLTLYEGLPYHPYYISELAHGVIRPNTFTAPKPETLAEHYPAAYLGVYQGGQRVAQFLNLYPPGSFEGHAELPELRVGPNRVTLRSDGTFGIVARGYPYEIHHGTPKIRGDQMLSADLTFAPTFNGVQHVRPFRPTGSDGAHHTWVLAAPHGHMTGRVQHVNQTDGIAILDLPIDSLGYHDHVFGLGPPGSGMKRTVWGHLIGEDFTVVWQRTIMNTNSQSKMSDAIVVFQDDRHPIVIESPTIGTERMRTSRWLVKYASHAALHGSDAKGNSAELLVDNKRVLERTPYHVRLLSEASLTIAGKRTYSGQGITTVMQLHRLRWPLLSDLVLMSIKQVPKDDPLWRD